MSGKKLLPLILTFAVSFAACSSASEADYIAKITRLIDGKDYSSARVLISDAMEKYPQSSDLFYYRGWVNMQTSLTGAAGDFNRALQIKPDSSNGYKGLGIVYTTQKKYKEAETAFENALKYSADDKQKSSVLADMAILSFEKKDYVKAEKLSKQAIAVRDTGDYYSTLGSSYYMTNRKKDAQSAWEQAAAKKSFDDESIKTLICFKLAALFAEQKNFAAAEHYLAVCLNNEPQNQDYLKMSAFLKQKK